MTSPIDIIVSDPKETELLENAELDFSEPSRALLASLETKSNFVQKSDAQADLGGPAHSCVFLKYTNDIEPDAIGYTEEDPESQDLALYVRVSGEKIIDELFYLIIQNHRSYLKGAGIMVKGSGDELWIRVSKKSPLAGTAFLGQLAGILSYRLKKEFPEIQSVCAVFVRGRGKSYQAIRKASTAFFKKNEALKAKVWEERGFNFNECHVLGHCGKCADKKLCASVRRIGRLSEARRENH